MPNKARPLRIGGCTFAEDPSLPAREARILWTAARNPFVLEARATPAGARFENAFDITKLNLPVSTMREGAGEHFLVGTAQACLRLDIVEGSLLDGPVTLTYLVPGVDAALPKVNTARRLIRAYRHARIAPAIALSSVARRREVARIKTFDALQGGASLREVGEYIYGVKAVREHWSGPGEHMKSAVRRLVASAKLRAAGGYKMMLMHYADKR